MFLIIYIDKNGNFKTLAKCKTRKDVVVVKATDINSFVSESE